MRLEKATKFKKEMEEARKLSLENKLKAQEKAEKKREDTFKMNDKMFKHKCRELQEKRELTKQRYQKELKDEELEQRRRHQDLMSKDKEWKHKQDQL